MNLWTKNQRQTGCRVVSQGLWPGDLLLPVRPTTSPWKTSWGPSGRLHIKPQQCMLTISSKKLLILLTHEKQVFDITDKTPLPSLGVNQWPLLFQHLILSLSGRGLPSGLSLPSSLSVPQSHL